MKHATINESTAKIFIGNDTGLSHLASYLAPKAVVILVAASLKLGFIEELINDEKGLKFLTMGMPVHYSHVSTV